MKRTGRWFAIAGGILAYRFSKLPPGERMREERKAHDWGDGEPPYYMIGQKKSVRV